MTILVTGATGTVGSNIVKQLVEAGHSVRALTRNPDATFPAGVEVFVGDLGAPETLDGVFAGIEAAHLITFGGSDYAPLQTGAAVLALAKQAGVKRLTVLNGGGETPLQSLIEAGDIDWTVIEPVEFMANHLEWAESIRAEGVVREPYINRVSAVVHEADIAAVAVAALTQDGHAGKLYTITGPEALTLRQKVALIAEASGRPIELVELSEQDARERWQAQGFDDDAIAFFVDVYGNTPEAGYTVLPTVEQVTGHPARTFVAWAREHAAAFMA